MLTKGAMPGQGPVLENAAKELVVRMAGELRTVKVTRFGPASNTGRAAESIAYELTENGFLITGNAYIYQLIFGREPGAMPPLSAIAEWMRERGIEGSAYPIAKAIAEKGTTIWQEHNPGTSGLFETAIAETAAQLTDELTDIFTQALIQSIYD